MEAKVKTNDNSIAKNVKISMFFFVSTLVLASVLLANNDTDAIEKKLRGINE